jgi:histidinol-phosphate aminotransferase
MTTTPRLPHVPHVPHAHALSANENPYPPLPSVARALSAGAARVNRYPDPFAGELREHIARRLRVPASHVAAGPGSASVLHQLMQAVVREGDEVLFAWPSFEAYPHLAEVCRARAVRVPLRDDAHDHDLPAMAEAIGERTRLVIVCNPNNPTGTAVTAPALARFLDRVDRAPGDVTVVLDEAYREFVTDPRVPDGAGLYRDRPRLVVLRTFSKAHGLAGLRVGYAIAREALAETIRRAALPFGVSSMGQAAAIASLAAGAEAELMTRVEALVKERHRMALELRDLGLPVAPSEANFLWLPLREHAAAFGELCAAQGALVRVFPGEGARITVGEPAAGAAIVAAAARFTRAHDLHW